MEEKNGLMVRNHYLKVILLIVFNIFDVISTGHILSEPSGYEANPIMASVMYHYGWDVFLGIKMGIVAFSCSILLYYKHNSLARQSTNILVVIYGMLTIYHSALIYALSIANA